MYTVAFALQTHVNNKAITTPYASTNDHSLTDEKSAATVENVHLRMNTTIRRFAFTQCRERQRKRERTKERDKDIH
jgi:hypothetical protein